MNQNTKKNKFSRRSFLLSGILAGLGGYLGYTNRKIISDWARWPYTRFIDERPNIIIIAMDTLRADHLGCYGYDRGISPNIDAFAKDSVLYWNTMSQSNWTLPAFASLFTSLYPHQHVTGMNFDKKKKVIPTSLPKSFTTLADVLSDIGYYTGAVTGGNYVSTLVGLDKGFKEFHQITSDMMYKINDLPWQIDKSTQWISKNHWTKKFFLFLHSYECHGPYVAPRKYIDLLDPDYDGPPVTGNVNKEIRCEKKFEITDELIGRYKTLYDAEIMFSDELLGNFFSFLKEKGIYDNTMIIFLSDHGEEFYEHGGWEHGITMFEEQLRVPIIIKFPRGYVKGVNKDRLARLIDVMPTILFDVLDLDKGKFQMAGVPLSEPLEQQFSISESLMSYEGIDISAFRSENMKYVINRKSNKESVFNLKEDPGELHDLAALNKNDLKRISALAGEAEMIYLQKMKEMNYPVNVDDDTIQMLKDLGYVQ